MQNEIVKQKITAIVRDYINAFPDEYQNVKRIVKQKRDAQMTKFASLKGNHAIERALTEYPEAMDGLFIIKLSVEDNNFLRSLEGTKWFARTFREFSLAENI